MFTLGLATGYGAHELGHITVATSKGDKVGHNGISIVYPDSTFSNSGHLQVASAGFQVQWLMAELALRDGNWKELRDTPSDYRAGVVCAHLGITFAYLTVLKNNKQGDVVGIAESTKLSNDRVAFYLALPGALDSWRLFGKAVPEWVPQLSLLAKGLGIAWAWTY